MRVCEIRVVFESENILETRKEISDIFYSFGATGLKISEPMKTFNPLDYFKSTEKFTEVDDAVSAYFPENIFSEKRNLAIKNKLEEVFGEREDVIYSVNIFSYEEEDYQNAWKNYIFPEKISEKFVVKPTWREYEKENEDEIIIELDPGRAFGTGLHPTTSLCVKLMEQNITPNSSVLDVGTGSGILMIVASKLGANNIAGIDIDELAVEVAKENLILNEVPENNFRVVKGDLIKNFEAEQFDFVVANILADVILILLKDISKVIKPTGKIILSGIIDSKLDLIIAEAKKLGYEILETMADKEWRAVMIGAKK